jgi:hypothetical protein
MAKVTLNLVLFNRVNSILGLGEDVYDVSLAPYNSKILFSLLTVMW